jgi:N-acylneuraminate cytidylyltransferase
MLEYIEASNLSETDIFVLVQATSPFTQSVHFNEGLKLFENHDTVLSCCDSKRFSWRNGKALNYDIFNRPRRQDFSGTLIENGAFYISLVADIKKTKNRISGNIGIYKMPEYTFTEIDEPEDWIVAESLMKKFVLKNEIPDFSNIKIFLSDVDGVLTDAGMYYTENGDEFKKFCTYDGMGFQILQKTGVKVGLLTSEDKDLNRRRAKKLGLDFDFHGAKDKLQIVKDVCKKENISLSEVAYIGDDVNCFELLSNVSFAACPNNAVAKIKSIPGIIQLSKNGGEGVVREFVEKILA